jgi:hypothetical protein
MNGYTRILGIEFPTRYLVGIGATVVAVLVLLVGGRGGSDKDQASPTSTTTDPTTTLAPNGKSPITIKQPTAADLVLRADWVKKGSSQYADPSDDRASTQTITTLAPSTSAVVPKYRPATTTTAKSGKSSSGSGSSGSGSAATSSSGTGG